MIQIIEDNVDFYDVYNKTKAPIVVWGAGDWAELFVHDTELPINYICDCNKKEFKYDIPVLSPKELYDKYCGKQIYIINSLDGIIKESSVYHSINQYPFQAKVFNLHKNCGFLKSNKGFTYKGRYYNLFQHNYLCGLYNSRMNQRALEIAIAQSWIDKYAGTDIVEIGTGAYGVAEKKTASMAINKILKESKHCLIMTAVNGVRKNRNLISWIEDNLMDDRVTIFYRGGIGNEWKELDKNKELKDMIEWENFVQNVYEFRNKFGGNCLSVVIEK